MAERPPVVRCRVMFTSAAAAPVRKVIAAAAAGETSVTPLRRASSVEDPG